MTNSKEIACVHCIHACICKHKEDYTKVVQSFDNLRISISENVEMYCRDLEFVRMIKPICKNYNVAIEDEDWRPGIDGGFMGLG